MDYTSNLWLQAIVVALHALDDKETEPISTLELIVYASTMAQDTVIWANDNYGNYFHVATVSVKINVILI